MLAPMIAMWRRGGGGEAGIVRCGGWGVGIVLRWVRKWEVGDGVRSRCHLLGSFILRR